MISILLLLNVELLCMVADFCETPKRRRLVLQTLSQVSKSLCDSARADALWKPVVEGVLPQLPATGFYRAAVAYGKELATLCPCPRYKVTLEFPGCMRSSGRLVVTEAEFYRIHSSEVSITLTDDDQFSDCLRITLTNKKTLEERVWQPCGVENWHMSSPLLLGGEPEVFEVHYGVGLMYSEGLWDGVEETFILVWVDYVVERGVKTLRNPQIHWTGNHTWEEVLQLLWENKRRPSSL